MSEIENEAENNPEEADSRPDWLPANFHTTEALAKSYQEQQGALTRLQQQNAEYERQISELVATTEQLQQQPQQGEQYDWDTLYEQNPLGTTALLIQQGIAQDRAAQGQVPPEQQAQQAAEGQAQAEMFAWQVDQLVAADPQVEDWQSYKEKVAQKINELPGLLPENLVSPAKTAAALREAYKAVRYDELAQEAAEGKTVKDVADDKRAAKLAAQTATGAAGRPEQTESDEEWFESLKAAHDQSYASRMANKGI